MGKSIKILRTVFCRIMKMLSEFESMSDAHLGQIEAAQN